MIEVNEDAGYTTIAQTVWFDRLKFCGCGSPELVLARVRDTLRAMKDRSDRNNNGGAQDVWMDGCRKVNEAAGPDDTSRYLLLYALDAAGLEEHGGSVNGGWPTQDGEQLLAFLESTPQDDWMPCEP